MPKKYAKLPNIAFALGCLLVFAAYWPGLSGPLLLDDVGNLADVGSWLGGERTWQSVIFNNRSGPGGRPLAMASFVLDAALWGEDVWHFKLTNLILHLSCGAALLGLYHQLLLRDPQLSQYRSWLAPFLATIWLALPVHASSVLYVVQRMAMLSAFFMLLALWCYVAARVRIERGERRGLIELWLAVPSLTALAFLSKENGLLIPLIALVIEMVYFRPAPNKHRPASVTAFFVIALVVPAVLAAAAFALAPQKLLQGYTLRNFTLYERLLTQTRILWDYVGSVLFPYGPRLSLYHDNFPKSSGLLTPWTTLIALLGWGAALVSAWVLRGKHRAIAAGILMYLAGHAMESSIFPLELYFEHRNYLPSIGLLLAATGVIAAIAKAIPTSTSAFKKAATGAAALTVIVYIGTTHGRAQVWSSVETLYVQELHFNPASPRLRSVLAGNAMQAGDMASALSHISVAEKNSPSQDAMALSLWRMLAYCAGKTAPPSTAYDALRQHSHGKIQTFAMTAWELLAVQVETGKCPGTKADELSSIARDWLKQNPLPRQAQQSWRTRYNLARLLASQSRFPEAIQQAELAWRDSANNNGIGVFLFQLNATVGNVQRCKAIYDHLYRSRGQGDLQLDRAIDTFGQALHSEES